MKPFIMLPIVLWTDWKELQHTVTRFDNLQVFMKYSTSHNTSLQQEILASQK